MVSKALVLVRVFKEFSYPKSMLHPKLFIQDALNKAQSDMQIFIDERINNDHELVNHQMFKYEAIEELGYKFRTRELKEETKGNSKNISKYCKVLTTATIEKKYGILNPEITPALFDHQPETVTPEGDIIQNEQWFMKDKIEKEYYNVYDNYYSLLSNV